MAEVTVRFAMPTARLRPYLSTYYEMTVTGEGQVSDILHPEWANIRIRLHTAWDYGATAETMERLVDQAMIHGPTSHTTYVRGSASSMFGIGILPTGWNRLWKANAAHFADRWPPLSDLMGEADADALVTAIAKAPDFDARAAAADAFMLALLDRSKRSAFDDQVSAFLQVLADPANASVDQITSTLGLPQARLARLAKRGFGFPPKLLLRRQRFLRMLGTLHARPYDEWPDFIDPQYVDQSHMIRDFQQFLGMSPSRYFSLDRPILIAAARARAAMFGQPLQGLHQVTKGG